MSLNLFRGRNAGLPPAAWQRHKVANSWGEVAAISVVLETLKEDAEQAAQRRCEVLAGSNISAGVCGSNPRRRHITYAHTSQAL